MTDTALTRPDREDRVGLYMTVTLAVALAVTAIVVAGRSLLRLAEGAPYDITVPLAGESAMLPLGPDGAMVEATVDAAQIHFTDPAAATLAAMWALPVIEALLVCVGAVLATRFLLRLTRGHIFAGGVSRILYGGVFVLILGGLTVGILTNMTTNGALATLSDQTYDSVTFEGDVMFAIGALLLGAMAVAFQIGERMHRDTEGLV